MMLAECKSRHYQDAMTEKKIEDLSVGARHPHFESRPAAKALVLPLETRRDVIRLYEPFQHA
jgi:hypothetical protein